MSVTNVPRASCLPATKEKNGHRHLSSVRRVVVCSSTTAKRGVRCVPHASFGFGKANSKSNKGPPVLTSKEVVPGQGKGSPKWREIHQCLIDENVKAVDARDLSSFVTANKNAILIDVRQTIEFNEWNVPPSVNVPYAIPDPNVVRRAVGYAISIKGGLKVRNPGFVDLVREARRREKKNASTIVLIDTKGGDLATSPTADGTSGVYDQTDSQALRAAFELTQAGDFKDVRYVKGGLPGAIEFGNMPYQSKKWKPFLEWLTLTNRDDTRKLLMYSRLLPDPTNLPGVLLQGGIFLFIGLGTYQISQIQAHCLPIQY
mgnify:CR=1 FL=1|jgi:rhodanese-related sulfurtransferase|tara:strand:+ start:1526 stop:2473 length:948 start_codon:yes stop_codon:yes gene_type:complete